MTPKKEKVDLGKLAINTVTRNTLTPAEMSTFYPQYLEAAKAQGVFVALTFDEYEKLRREADSARQLKGQLEREEAAHRANNDEKRALIDKAERTSMRLNRAAHALVDAIGGSTGSEFHKLMLGRPF